MLLQYVSIRMIKKLHLFLRCSLTFIIYDIFIVLNSYQHFYHIDVLCKVIIAYTARIAKLIIEMPKQYGAYFRF